MKFREHTFVIVRNTVTGQIGEMTIITEFDQVVRETGIHPLDVTVSIRNAQDIEVLHTRACDTVEVADTETTEEAESHERD